MGSQRVGLAVRGAGADAVAGAGAGAVAGVGAGAAAGVEAATVAGVGVATVVGVGVATVAGVGAATVAGVGSIGERLVTFVTLVTLVTLVSLAGCASPGSSTGGAAKTDKPRDAAASAPVDEPNAQLQRFRVRDWSALDDHTIIVTADNGTRYRAETMGPCIGLNFATALAFDTRGGFNQLDRFSSVVLGDGTRCALRSFDRLKAPAERALDSYEKRQ